MTPELFCKCVGFTDADLTFLVHSFHDFSNLEPMLANCRQFFPEARLIVCSDGDRDPRLARVAALNKAEFHLGDNLYALGNGGQVCHRMLELFLQKPTKYLFKVDPDTGFHRRFDFLPGHSGMFGTLQCSPMLCSIQGGCCGITLDWARKLHCSKAFLDSSLMDATKTWATYEPLWLYMKKVGRVSSDWMFGYVATANGCPQFGFSEVMSNWKKPVANPNCRYAVTHPVRQSTSARSAN